MVWMVCYRYQGRPAWATFDDKPEAEAFARLHGGTVHRIRHYRKA